MTRRMPIEVEVPVHGVTLDPALGWARKAPRAREERQPGYDACFDRSTLFYDVFRVGEDVELIGPPLLNLAEGLRPLDLRAGSRRYARRLTSTEKDRLHRHTVSGVPASVTRLNMSCALGRHKLLIGEDLAEHFAGRRVLVTQSQNNPLPWIAQWVDHHIAAHGIDAVVLYDNASSAYTASDVRAVLRERRGLAGFAVVEWPYPFGPTGGVSKRWDSDFGQHGAWEHSYRRLCRLAETITFADVDELIVGPKPAVPDRALAAPTGVCMYGRRSILAVTEHRRRTGVTRRYADYLHFSPGAPLVSPKYTVVPAALEREHQLMVHRVDGITVEPSRDLLGRHFDGMRIEWRDGDESPVPEARLEDAPHDDVTIDVELRTDLDATGLLDHHDQSLRGNT